MILQRIQLINFRNIAVREFDIHPVLTIIIGENARGKTNLLEGIYFSVYGVGFRETKESELVKWDEERSIIETFWIEDENSEYFQIVIDKKDDDIAKKFFVNKVRKPHNAYSQFQSKAILFAPEHIEIITSAPDRRREYFNRLISTYDNNYKKSLHNYEHALYRRNKILEHHLGTNLPDEELVFWDDYLEKNGLVITKARQEYTDFLNAHRSVDGKSFNIEYIKNEFTKERLKKSRPEEMRLRRTVIGPQKDDFAIYLTDGEEKNVHHFGSRSEQRMGVFWLKLNEIRYFEEILKKKPLLLLDDIFSELDTKNKSIILGLIEDYQTVLTTTEKELLDLAHVEKKIIML